jgi:hypothetical protein
MFLSIRDLAYGSLTSPESSRKGEIFVRPPGEKKKEDRIRRLKSPATNVRPPGEKGVHAGRHK